MDYQKIKNSTNLKDLDPASIFELDNFESIKYYACDCIDSLDWDECLAIANILNSKLTQASVRSKEDQYTAYVLRFWVLKLKLFAFATLPESEKLSLIKDSVAEMYGYGLDVQGVINDYVGFFGSPEAIQKETKSFVQALSGSQKILASDLKRFQGINFKPTVANWIKEYQTVLRPATGMKLEPGAFHIVKFMDSNQFAKMLSQEDQLILRELLDLYNWLLNPKIYSSNNRVGDSQSYTNTQRFTLPQELDEPEIPDEPIMKLPPVVPAPKNAPSVRPMGDVDTAVRKQELGIGNATERGAAGGVKLPPKLPPVLPPVSIIMEKQGVATTRAPQMGNAINGYRPELAKNIHDILQQRDSEEGAGLKTTNSNKPVQPGKNQFSIANKNSSSLSASALEKKLPVVDAAKQAEIDRKLEELEKKIK